jgi:hypothetical protein
VNGLSMESIVDNHVFLFSFSAMNIKISQISLDIYMLLPPPVEIALFLLAQKIEFNGSIK